MTKLEQEVLDIINTTIDGKYIGKLRVLVDKDVYQLYLYFDRWYTPTILGYEGTEDEFKKFVKKEFKTRKMEKTKYYSITREPIVLDLNIKDDE